jgi:hypothetical protein
MPALHRTCSSRTMFDRMMDCSQQQISEIAQRGDGHQKLVAIRVLESTSTRKLWEGSHSQLLRNIVTAPTTDDQIHAIRRMGLTMIHRKAPFEYLRDRHVCGPARRRFFEVVYGRQDFSSSFVREHRNYLQAGASYMCLDRFCAESSMRSLTDYERQYAEYVRTQFLQMDTEQRGSDDETSAWLGFLRGDLQRQRQTLLTLPPSRADALTLEELYRPTGDTVRITYFAPVETRY